MKVLDAGSSHEISLTSLSNVPRESSLASSRVSRVNSGWGDRVRRSKVSTAGNVLRRTRGVIERIERTEPRRRSRFRSIARKSTLRSVPAVNSDEVSADGVIDRRQFSRRFDIPFGRRNAVPRRAAPRAFR